MHTTADISHYCMDVVILGHECGMMLCLVAVPGAAQSACHGALEGRLVLRSVEGLSGACREVTVA